MPKMSNGVTVIKTYIFLTIDDDDDDDDDDDHHHHHHQDNKKLTVTASKELHCTAL